MSGSSWQGGYMARKVIVGFCWFLLLFRFKKKHVCVLLLVSTARAVPAELEGRKHLSCLAAISKTAFTSCCNSG